MCRRKARPGLSAEPGSKLWSCSCVSTANHFQMGLWRFMSWVIAIPTHVQARGPKEGEAQLRAGRKMPNSSGVWVWLCLINVVLWHSVYEIGGQEDGCCVESVQLWTQFGYKFNFFPRFLNFRRIKGIDSLYGINTQILAILQNLTWNVCYKQTHWQNASSKSKE